ncbi:MAG: deoxyribonuclease IV [Armatimonadota bacterium]
MRLGVHVWVGRGLGRALDYAVALGCESIQLFSSNPNSWTTGTLDPEAARLFAEKITDLRIWPVVVHTPYLLNLAAPSLDIWIKSRDALFEAVRRARMLGAEYVVTHIGSHKGHDLRKAYTRVATAVSDVLGSNGGVEIVLELGSGAGNGVGSHFEEVAEIIERIDCSERVGIAIDTAHLYAAGYDISTSEGVSSMFERLDSVLGLDRLKVVHLNDTQVQLGSRKDRHYHIGLGNIGMAGFRSILRHPATRELPGIIETPAEGVEWDIRNLKVLRELRSYRRDRF